MKILLRKKVSDEVNKCLTYSLTSKYLSPSLATHLPRLLIVEPLKVIGCCSPDWNHEPFHCWGKTQFVDAVMKENRKKMVNKNLLVSWKELAATFELFCVIKFIKKIANKFLNKINFSHLKSWSAHKFPNKLWFPSFPRRKWGWFVGYVTLK